VRTAPFELRGDRDDVRLVIGAAASLAGRRPRDPGRPRSRRRASSSSAGGGVLRTAAVARDGAYRLERLPPGRYVARAYVGDRDEAVRASAACALRRRARAHAEVPESLAAELTLAAGERRELDLDLELPRVGAVAGSVSVSGRPPRAASTSCCDRRRTAVLVGGPALRATPDSRGLFVLRDVAPGSYAFQVVTASSRQELHREPIAGRGPTAASTSTSGSTYGALRGRLVEADGAPADRSEGTLTLLPGVATMPDDLRAFRAHAPGCRSCAWRGGAFQADPVAAGSALAVVEIRGTRAGRRPDRRAVARDARDDAPCREAARLSSGSRAGAGGASARMHGTGASVRRTRAPMRRVWIAIHLGLLALLLVAWLVIDRGQPLVRNGLVYARAGVVTWPTPASIRGRSSPTRASPTTSRSAFAVGSRRRSSRGSVPTTGCGSRRCSGRSPTCSRRSTSRARSLPQPPADGRRDRARSRCSGSAGFGPLVAYQAVVGPSRFVVRGRSSSSPSR
jgi:hypothetical protein